MTPHEESVKKACRFEHPDFIPMIFAINGACWHHYPQEQLFDLMESHPLLFPDFQRPEGKFVPEYHPVARKDHPYVDDFGCRWETADDGLTGTVVGHPLKDWAAFDSWKAPDPSQCMGIGPINWEQEKIQYRKRKEEGHFLSGGLRHGHTFLQLCDLRGYENLLFDMVDEEPKLWQLIQQVESFNRYIVDQYLDIGVDMMSFAEDLGMQVGPMLSPEHFRKYIKPSYQRLMKPALDSDTIVHMHSDGDIRSLADDLLESGVEVLNLQDLVNGVDWIRERYRGKLCIDLDIDRQNITRFGTPDEIRELIRYEVSQLGDPAGGLMMIFGLYPGMPLENIKALMDAMEENAFYFSK